MAYLIALLILISALCLNMRNQRIPNILCLSGLFIAVILPILFNQWHEVWQAILGACLALALLGPIYFFRFLGLGEIKVMIAIGALSGPELLLFGVIYAGLIVVLMKLILTCYKLVRRLINKVTIFLDTKSEKENSSMKSNFQTSYVPSLALGWLLACYNTPEVAQLFGVYVELLI